MCAPCAARATCSTRPARAAGEAWATAGDAGPALPALAGVAVRRAGAGGHRGDAGIGDVANGAALGRRSGRPDAAVGPDLGRTATAHTRGVRGRTAAHPPVGGAPGHAAAVRHRPGAWLLHR